MESRGRYGAAALNLASAVVFARFEERVRSNGWKINDGHARLLIDVVKPTLPVDDVSRESSLGAITRGRNCEVNLALPRENATVSLIEQRTLSCLASVPEERTKWKWRKSIEGSSFAWNIEIRGGGGEDNLIFLDQVENRVKIGEKMEV